MACSALPPPTTPVPFLLPPPTHCFPHVCCARWSRGRLTLGADDNGDNEPVDANHTSHDDGDDGCTVDAKVSDAFMISPISAKGGRGGLLHSHFMMRPGCMTPIEQMPTPDLAVP